MRHIFEENKSHAIMTHSSSICNEISTIYCFYMIILPLEVCDVQFREAFA